MQREDILNRIVKIDNELKRRNDDGKLSGYNKGKKSTKSKWLFTSAKSAIGGFLGATARGKPSAAPWKVYG